VRCAFNLPSVAITTTNGDGALHLLALHATFRDRHLSFRHMPQARCSEIRWQAGREVLDPITMPDGSIMVLERFELLHWGRSADELIAKLGSYD